VPVALGGAGASGVEVAIVTEALARHACTVPFAGAVLAADLLAAAGASADVLAAVATGERRVAVALDGRAWDCCGADVAVGSDEAGRVHVVAVGDALHGVDLTRALAAVGETVDLGPLARPVLGVGDRPRWEALAVTVLCADVVGVMDGTLAAAVAHARERVQFGRPIGSFQAVQHLLADQLVAVEAARSATWYAAWAVDELPASDALLAARAAKAWCSAAGPEVAEAAIQVWGGLGMTWECMAHVFLRRALLDARTLGGEDAQFLLDEAEGYELQWYASQEITPLLERL